MKNIVIGILILVLAIGLVVALFSMGTNDSQTETATSTPEIDDQTQTDTDTVFGSMESWNDFADQSLTADWLLSIQLPSIVQTSNPQQGIYSFQYIGPNSEPATEITDGFLFTITAQADTSLPEYLDEVEAPTGTETVTFNGYEAASFTRPSELGEQRIPHTVFVLSDDTTVIDVTQSAYGQKSATYQDVMEQILNTLTFTEFEEEVAADLINVASPQTRETVSSPISVSGEARGYWFFEATAPVTVTNWDGLIIGEGFIEADGNWMTEDFVPFSGEITYTQEPSPYSATGTVIFSRANPSGLPENDAAVEVRVQLEDNSN